MNDIIFNLEGVNGQLTVYENRVIIERKGFYGFLSHGLAGIKTIPMDSIMAVQFKEGGEFFRGFIQFCILGGKEGIGGIISATRDENTVMIDESENNKAREIKEYIENVILNRNSNKTVIQATSLADELKKFKELLDAGIITQKEFDTKKKQLLD